MKGNQVASTHGHSLRCDKGVLLDGSQDVTELDFRCKGVSVVDDWHSIWSIPAVHWKLTDMLRMSFTEMTLRSEKSKTSLDGNRVAARALQTQPLGWKNMRKEEGGDQL